MTNPFPGIDPYLESQGLWPNFQHTFLRHLRDALADRLPDRYELSVIERKSLVTMPPEEGGRVLPVQPIGRPPFSSAVLRAPTGTLFVEPVTIPVPFVDEETEVALEFLHRPTQALVGVINVLSPGNKTGPGQVVYLAHRNALLRQAIHLIELDFLVAGFRVPMRRPLPPGDYYALVARGDQRPDCQVYAWSVRQPLPTIRLPLSAPDADAELDLSAVFATAYERGRYACSIDYSAPLTVPLAPSDLAWAEE